MTTTILKTFKTHWRLIAIALLAFAFSFVITSHAIDAGVDTPIQAACPVGLDSTASQPLGFVCR
jgi:hypothetical protein